MICLRQRELLSEPGTRVTEITLDHEFLMSSYSTASERALSNTALALHAGVDLRVLVGGLGLGYTAAAALASERVGRVDVVELIPQVIAWLEQGLVPLSETLRADARFSVREGDVYAQLAGPPAHTYDLILIDVDHSPDERLGTSSQGFYTEAGLEQVQRHLAPDGVLAVWSYTESSPFADALRRVFDDVRVETVRFQNELVGVEEDDCLFFARSPRTRTAETTTP
jgi:spermidine synthase